MPTSVARFAVLRASSILLLCVEAQAASAAPKGSDVITNTPSPVLGFFFILLWALQIPQVLVQTSVRWDSLRAEGTCEKRTAKRHSRRGHGRSVI